MSNYNEFFKLYQRIPKDRLSNVWFILLKPFSKRPVNNGSWLNEVNHLNVHNIKVKMMNGFNIGIVALPKGIMIVDIDTDESHNLIIPPNIKEKLDNLNTFTVETRSKGLHYYFLNDSKHNTQDIIIGDKNIGEIRANTSYVLTSGCTVNSDGYEGNYKVLYDNDIKVFPEEFNNILNLTCNEPLKANILKNKVGKPLTDRIKKLIELHELKKKHMGV